MLQQDVLPLEGSLVGGFMAELRGSYNSKIKNVFWEDEDEQNVCYYCLFSFTITKCL